MATIDEDKVQFEAMRDFCREGTARAMALGNRGPIRFTANGQLHPDIVEAYDRCGFYVFERVIAQPELGELQAAHDDIVTRLPVSPDSQLDSRGRPAIGSEHGAPSVMWSKPLSDPFGGSAVNKGRHQVRMYEPRPAPHLPEILATGILAPLQYHDALLRTYAHPELLKVAAAVNGEDFVPFTEALGFKKAGEGPSVAWHQDGMTHWDSPEWHDGIHGFNFMVQLFGSIAWSGVWYILGSHKHGKADIAALFDEAGGERLPDAVPLVCEAGDVAISNRQVIHGSFANNGEHTRVTFNMGFMPRRSVQDVVGRPFGTDHDICYDDALIRERSRMISYAIDARSRRFPDEKPYDYRPHAGESLRWDETARRASYGYNLKDMVV
ncbi:MAG: phytanoyl-CoA dioxygenase family protein [Novosphingobium sp.]|nr:phytanoyl-CoA dioxygenase family protein [Novosphingobium sp.]